MNKRVLKSSLIGVASLALIGTVGAQTYYSHKLAQRVEQEQQAEQQAQNTMPDYVPTNPWAAMHADMMRMQAQVDQAMANAVRGMPAQPGFNGPGMTQVSLQEQGNDYVVKADVPGAKKGDVNVNLNGRVLSISSQSKGSDKQTDDHGKLVRQENFSSSFQQAFTLPGPVNAAGMKTQVKDGVLTVTIPKATS
jgi:HSP20 family protein